MLSDAVRALYGRRLYDGFWTMYFEDEMYGDTHRPFPFGAQSASGTDFSPASPSSTTQRFTDLAQSKGLRADPKFLHKP